MKEGRDFAINDIFEGADLGDPAKSHSMANVKIYINCQGNLR